MSLHVSAPFLNQSCSASAEGFPLYWITEYHIDALRLDAGHGIYDFGARHILQELSTAVHSQAEYLGRKVYLIAETDLNDTRIISSSSMGGYGIDAQWR
jgi:maltooligosyltrehalose trehalohydrolase